MTLTATFDEPFLTTCDFCHVKTAAMPGPRNRRVRSEPPAGFTLGYVMEESDGRQSPICFDCLRTVTTTV